MKTSLKFAKLSCIILFVIKIRFSDELITLYVLNSEAPEKLIKKKNPVLIQYNWKSQIRSCIKAL